VSRSREVLWLDSAPLARVTLDDVDEDLLLTALRAFEN
jgi:hypothetical protein